MTDSTKNEQRARRRLSRASVPGFFLRTALVALIDALGVYAVVGLLRNSSWAVASLLIVSLALVNWAYLSPRTRAARWLTPGLVLMLIFVLYPVMYTTYISFTNFQTGNLLDKEQAVARLQQVDIRSGAAGHTVSMAVYRQGPPKTGDLALLVGGGDTEPFFGPLRAGAADTEVVALADATGLDPTAPPEQIDGYSLVTKLGLTAESSRLNNAEINLPGGSFARVKTLSQATVMEGGKRFTYDAAADTLYDNQLDVQCHAGVGTFYCNDVPEDAVQRVARLATKSTIECNGGTCDEVPLYALDQSLAGWQQFIGPDNYVDVLTNERIRAPFLRVLSWNIVFAFGSVLLNFALGLGLALALKDDRMRGRSFYRSIYIIPYAIPGFLSILVWRGLLDPNFGKVNAFLGLFGVPDINWLGTSMGAMTAVLLVNLWLGFPYMFLICSGALTSIPEELIEAAKVDGAGPWKTFRMITLPLLLVSTAPLLIGAFAFNFNNYVLIALLTDGGPPLVNYDVPVGATDLLISFTFGIAAGAGRGSQYALASAIIVIIFLVLATTAAMSFRLTKKLEEIYDQ